MDIRIIGCGKMGNSLVKILSKSHSVSVYDINSEKAKELARNYDVFACREPFENLLPTSVVLLAIKPHDFSSFVKRIPSLPPFKLLISILTGIKLSSLKSAFPSVPVLRMMPNLAVGYGDGVVMLATEETAHPLKEEIESLFSPLGLLYWIAEEHFDAATSLTGSGPAFVFTLIESMVDAAICMGLSAEEAYPLIIQMISGSLTLLKETKKSPCDLKWEVTSPGGTTIQGLRAFEAHGVRSGILETFLAAQKRAQELG